MTRGHAMLCEEIKSDSMASVAAALECDRTSIWRYINHNHIPRIPIAIKMRERYGIPIDAWDTPVK